MSIFRNARFEKQLGEIRAVVSWLEELEVSDDLKLGRNYLFIWADHIIKLIESMTKDVEIRLQNYFGYRRLIKEILPAVNRNSMSFFVAAEDFKKRLRSQGG